MIVFDLRCRDSGDVMKAWFGSSDDYEDLLARGLVVCPMCRSSNVTKAPMAPNVPLPQKVLTASRSDTPVTRRIGHARDLIAEGVPVALLPFPVVLPDQVN